MSTSYLSMVSGSRIKNFLGLVMDEGVEFSYPPTIDSQYAYIQIPVREILTSTAESTEKALRNQHIHIVPACSVEVKGNYRFEVMPNPAFWEFGTAQGHFYLEPGEGRVVPSFHVALRKDLPLETAKGLWAIRIYMRS